jgi:hypothetical protein
MPVLLLHPVQSRALDLDVKRGPLFRHSDRTRQLFLDYMLKEEPQHTRRKGADPDLLPHEHAPAFTSGVLGERSSVIILGEILRAEVQASAFVVVMKGVLALTVPGTPFSRLLALKDQQSRCNASMLWLPQVFCRSRKAFHEERSARGICRAADHNLIANASIPASVSIGS